MNIQVFTNDDVRENTLKSYSVADKRGCMVTPSSQESGFSSSLFLNSLLYGSLSPQQISQSPEAEDISNTFITSFLTSSGDNHTPFAEAMVEQLNNMEEK